MKRTISLILMLSLVAVLLISCNSTTTVPASTNQNPTAAPQSAETTPNSEAENPVWPIKPITVIVPYSAGGTADTVARILSTHLVEELGVAVNVVNQPGASGEIGTMALVESKPDGYTLGVCNNPDIQISCICSADFKLDFHNDLNFLATYTANGISVFTPVDCEWNTFESFVEYCKAKPGVLAVGESGTGARMMIATVMDTFNIKVTSVNFNGAGELSAAALGRHVDAVAAGSNAISSYAGGGWKPISWGGVERLADFPDTPLADELGLKSSFLDVMTVFVSPAGTPGYINERLLKAFDKIAENPEVKTQIEAVNCAYDYKSGEKLASTLFGYYDAVESICQGEFRDFIITDN